MGKIAYVISPDNITVNYAGQTHIVPRTDALANKLIQAIKDRNLDEIPNLVSAAKRIEKSSNGQFVVCDGQILVNGVPAPPVLGNKILKFANEGLPYEPLVKFAENLQKNPSFRAVNELFQFLEKNDHPITEDGNFIAYKKVRDNFLDCHTGTMDNSPGKVLQIPRNQVDENPNQTCSYGLHVANWDYANNFYGPGRMLEVEVNPADVVAVPVDYNQAKMRVCRYKVLGEVDREHSSDVVLRRTRPVDDSDSSNLDHCCDSDVAHEDCSEQDDCIYCGEPTYGYNVCDDCFSSEYRDDYL